MKFFVGLAVGALGMWAYRGGKLQGLIGQAPAPVQDAFSAASQRVSQVANNDQLREFASNMQGKGMDDSEVAIPSAPEVSSRPSEPLP
jgi:hypothetical protein